MLEILPPVCLPGLNYSFQFEKIFYFLCLCFRVTYAHNRDLSDIASQIEEGVNVTKEKKVSLLVASWILVRWGAMGSTLKTWTEPPVSSL